MKWDNCRYCSTGKMVPTGETRLASYDAGVTEIAHACDSCDKHPGSHLWVAEDKASPPARRPPDLGDAEYIAVLASAQASVSKSSMSEQAAYNAVNTFVIVGVAILFLIVGAVAAVVSM